MINKFKFLCSIFFIFAISFISMWLIIIQFRFHLPYKQGKLNNINYINIRPYYVNEEYINKEIFKLFNLDNYSIEKCLFTDSNKAGDANLFTGKIRISYNLSYEDYVLALTHELVHIIYMTGNERFCNFKAFVILYESDNNYFKNIALAYADLEKKGEVIYEYSCIGYIEEYLRGK